MLCSLLALWVAVGSAVLAVPIEITFATHWGAGGHYELLQKYIAEYNAMQSDVVVRHIQSARFDSAINEQFLVAAAAGAAWDIVHVSSTSLLQYGHQLRLLAPVPAALATEFKSRFLPAALDLATLKGVLYGPPTENQMHSLTLNGLLFDQAGVAVKAPQSWDQLLIAARKLTKRTADGRVDTAGIELVDSRALLSLGWSNGAELLNAAGTRFTLDTPAWRETVEFERRLIESEVATISSTIFNQNKAGMRLGGAPGCATTM